MKLRDSVHLTIDISKNAVRLYPEGGLYRVHEPAPRILSGMRT